MERHFRDGHSETWWAADARLGGYGPDSPRWLVVATTDPARLPEKANWYLAANLPYPDAPAGRPRHAPPPGPGQLCLLLLLGPVVRPPRTPRCHRAGPVPRRGPERGPRPPHRPQQPCWPRALQAIGSWLAPAVTLNRWWRAWTDKDPPSELPALIDAVTTGRGIDLYRRI